ncbi:hypothetical protein [Micromonospora sp. CMU55-4]|uniref:hypothetical protein n=1 Tax=Micromonospora sp. CMU55-4 TaxID=2717028 RepID=UPI00140A1C29|nr:hypothetical protein [Micromonospora sp. CMU55-4]NHO80352.1 hypothetical protein [Micromonospora sp. CMU55-4]
MGPLFPPVRNVGPAEDLAGDGVPGLESDAVTAIGQAAGRAASPGRSRDNRTDRHFGDYTLRSLDVDGWTREQGRSLNQAARRRRNPIRASRPTLPAEIN